MIDLLFNLASDHAAEIGTFVVTAALAAIKRAVDIRKLKKEQRKGGRNA